MSGLIMDWILHMDEGYCGWTSRFGYWGWLRISDGGKAGEGKAKPWMSGGRQSAQ